MMNKLRYFVQEREFVRLEKLDGAPAPWTEDALLQKYRFCNVRRRDDRVSKWLIKNWYDPYRNSSRLWFMAVVARWINWPPMLDKLTDLFKASELSDRWFDNLGDLIDETVQSGGKAWTGAYMITARAIPDGRGKGSWISHSTLKPIWLHREKFDHFFSLPVEARGVQSAMSLFKGEFNHGTFMSGQIVADWTYTPLLDRAPDLYTYAPIGPGSSRGLNRLYGRELDKSIKQEQFNAELQHVRANLPAHIAYNLSLHCTQNCMCEFDKYIRLEHGGRTRANYQPETRFLV
jgi:hypothetical protein